MRQGFPQRRGHMSEFLREALAGTRCISAGHLDQDDQPRRPLHQGADGRAIARPLEEITFPVTRHRARGHVDGTLGNRRHIGDVAPAIRPRDRDRRILRA